MIRFGHGLDVCFLFWVPFSWVSLISGLTLIGMPLLVRSWNQYLLAKYFQHINSASISYICVLIINIDFVWIEFSSCVVFSNDMSKENAFFFSENCLTENEFLSKFPWVFAIQQNWRITMNNAEFPQKISYI